MKAETRRMGLGSGRGRGGAVNPYGVRSTCRRDALLLSKLQLCTCKAAICFVHFSSLQLHPLGSFILYLRTKEALRDSRTCNRTCNLTVVLSVNATAQWSVQCTMSMTNHSLALSVNQGEPQLSISRAPGTRGCDRPNTCALARTATAFNT